MLYLCNRKVDRFVMIATTRSLPPEKMLNT